VTSGEWPFVVPIGGLLRIDILPDRVGIFEVGCRREGDRDNRSIGVFLDQAARRAVSRNPRRGANGSVL